LIPITQLDAVLPDEKQGLIVTYSLAHTAMIHLHRGFALGDAVSFEKCSQASRACISVVKHISDGDFAFLEPIIGVRAIMIYSEAYIKLSLRSRVGGLLQISS
jgi:hypothetical protein